MGDIRDTIRYRRNPRDRSARRIEPISQLVPVRALRDNAGLVIAVLDCAHGALSRQDIETLSAARVWADLSSGGVAALPLHPAGGQAMQVLADNGVDRIVGFPALQGIEAGAAAHLIGVCMSALDTQQVVGADTALVGEALRWLSVQTSLRICARVSHLGADGAWCWQGDGRSERLVCDPAIALIAPDCFDPLDLDWRGEALPVDVDVPSAPDSALVFGPVIKVDSSTVALAEAAFIVSAGNGVSDWPRFHALSATLKAAEAGSRVVVDAGLLPRSRQVGASGEIVHARCYLALGISGAVQHLQGIEDCQKVIAVNIDPYAPIMARADLAIVADVQLVMAAFLEEVGANGH